MNRFNTKGKRTYNVSEIQVGDIVKFKGTRNKGFRRILDINPTSKWTPDFETEHETIDYFNRVLMHSTSKGVSYFADDKYTSTNSVDKLSHVFRDGTWFKVIKD